MDYSGYDGILCAVKRGCIFVSCTQCYSVVQLRQCHNETVSVCCELWNSAKATIVFQAFTFWQFCWFVCKRVHSNYTWCIRCVCRCVRVYRSNLSLRWKMLCTTFAVLCTRFNDPFRFTPYILELLCLFSHLFSVLFYDLRCNWRQFWLKCDSF